MSVQTTYEKNMGIGFAGQILDMNPKEVVTKTAEVAVGYGFPVVRTTDENEVKVPTATGQDFFGIATSTLANYTTSGTASTYGIGDSLGVMRSGYTLVKVNQIVEAGDPVFFIHTGDVGQFRKDLDTDKADAIAGATFESGAGVGELAKIRLKG